MLVYSSSPVKKIIGLFTIADIVEDSQQDLWARFREVGGIQEEEFFNYYKNREKGYSICIHSTNLFDEPVDPYQLISDFVPPQSFRYYEGTIPK